MAELVLDYASPRARRLRLPAKSVLDVRRDADGGFRVVETLADRGGVWLVAPLTFLTLCLLWSDTGRFRRRLLEGRMRDGDWTQLIFLSVLFLGGSAVVAWALFNSFRRTELVGHADGSLAVRLSTPLGTRAFGVSAGERSDVRFVPDPLKDRSADRSQQVGEVVIQTTTGREFRLFDGHRAMDVGWLVDWFASRPPPAVELPVAEVVLRGPDA